MSKPQYSQDLIRRYREMLDTKAFRRETVGVAPVDLDYDLLTLSCGHCQETSRYLVLAGEGKVPCRACEKEWLAKAVEEEQRGGDQR
jgi:hypothetical protein